MTRVVRSFGGLGSSKGTGTVRQMRRLARVPHCRSICTVTFRRCGRGGGGWPPQLPRTIGLCERRVDVALAPFRVVFSLVVFIFTMFPIKFLCCLGDCPRGVGRCTIHPAHRGVIRGLLL